MRRSTELRKMVLRLKMLAQKQSDRLLAEACRELALSCELETKREEIARASGGGILRVERIGRGA